MTERGGTWIVEGPLARAWKARKGAKEAEAELEALSRRTSRSLRKEIEKRRWRKAEETTRKGRGGGMGTRRKRKTMRKRDNGCAMYHRGLMGMLQLLVIGHMRSVDIGRGYGAIQQTGMLATSAQHLDTSERTATIQEGMRKGRVLGGNRTLGTSACVLDVCRDVDLGRVSVAQWDTIGRCDTFMSSSVSIHKLGSTTTKNTGKVLWYMGLRERRTCEKEEFSAGS